jgi:hypothetical protein
LNVVGLNCSTATAEEDDPTIRRCIAFAKRWGFSRLVMTNVFAFRATDPAVMKQAFEPVGPRNDGFLQAIAAHEADMVLAAWGSHARFRDGGLRTVRLLTSIESWCLEKRRAATLFVAGGTSPRRWRPRATDRAALGDRQRSLSAGAATDGRISNRCAGPGPGAGDRRLDASA